MRKTKRIKVRAGDGLRMPILPGMAIDTPSRYFTPENVVEVYLTAFVRKRLACGDLVEVVADAPKPKRADKAPKSEI